MRYDGNLVGVGGYSLSIRLISSYSDQRTIESTLLCKILPNPSNNATYPTTTTPLLTFQNMATLTTALSQASNPPISVLHH